MTKRNRTPKSRTKKQQQNTDSKPIEADKAIKRNNSNNEEETAAAVSATPVIFKRWKDWPVDWTQLATRERRIKKRKVFSSFIFQMFRSLSKGEPLRDKSFDWKLIRESAGHGDDRPPA